MRRHLTLLIMALLMIIVQHSMQAQQRRPINNENPLWLIHIDVWNKADPQKIIDLIPEDIKPYVCLNLSMSCAYDTEREVYKMPQNAILTYKSWASVCQHNGMWFTCQPASGGHTHIMDDDLEIFEYFYKRYPNFLGWNYCEQFWGFDEPNDKSSSTQADRLALFAKLVPMAHKYGGFLTISFCGNVWSHLLNPVGMMKRNRDLLAACKAYPEACLWLYKYTTSSCFYNNESVTLSPFISGLATNYGVRYDNCGWNGALDALLGEGHGKKYPTAAGLGTVMEQTCVNGGAVWDGPELIWTEDFQNLSNTTVDGFQRRNWGTFKGFQGGWIDMFRKIIDGTMYIPTRKEVVEKTKIVVVNDVQSGNDEQKYAAWGDLYDGLYKQDDPFNRGNGQWMDNFCYFKKTGRYSAIPVVIALYDSVAKAIPVQVKKSQYQSRWPNQSRKVADFNSQYPEVSTGDMYVSRYQNQLITYTPYTYLNKKTTSEAKIPLLYNCADSLYLTYGKLSSGVIREFSDSIVFYLNNYRSDTLTMQTDNIVITGLKSQPSYKMTRRNIADGSSSGSWDEAKGTYSIRVKHRGGVDLVVRMNETAAASAETLKPHLSSIKPLGMPKLPEDYRGEIIIEAEDMDYKDVKSCVTDPYGWYPNVFGHAGNGFIDMGTNTSGMLRHQLMGKHAGDNRIAIRYTSPQRSGDIAAVMNGTRFVLKCEKTANNEWRRVEFEAPLKAEKNNLVIINTGGAPMYIDNVTYTPSDIPAEKFLITVREAEHGSVTASVSEAAAGEKVQLTITPDEGYALTGWVVIHGKVEISEDGSFVMPEDIVTIQPIFADKTAIYAMDFEPVLNGTIPAGWRIDQGGGEIHEYPNSYGSGSRTFAGFTGYQGKGLYWRVGKAEYGRQEDFPLTLAPGSYKLSYAMAAWKGSPNYKVAILSKTGSLTVASKGSATATPNANGNQSANLSSAKLHELEFEINESGDYVISFQNAGSGFEEFLLLECRINTATVNGITSVEVDHVRQPGIYSLSGVRQQSLQPGINIVVTSDGKVKKVSVK